MISDMGSGASEVHKGEVFNIHISQLKYRHTIKKTHLKRKTKIASTIILPVSMRTQVLIYAFCFITTKWHKLV